MEDWVPPDFTPFPSFLKDVTDEDMRTFAWNVIAIWPKLTRRIKQTVSEHPSRHSIIYLPNGIVVPGGRFRESYYWDTYWIIKGLLASEMHTTARGLLDNFVHLIKTYGFIPNGGRVYFTRRSQPPLFTSMSMEYFKYTGNITWVRRNIEFMEKEVLSWQSQMIKVGKHMLARYLPKSTGPRAESYKEDYTLAMRFPERERDRVYVDLKACAESGWDFSSRWFYGGAGGNLSQLHTGRTLPVDLNAYLGKCYHDLAHFYSVLGNPIKQNYWNVEYDKMKYAIYDVFWNETDGTWYDFDLKQNVHRRQFFPSNLAPLWAGIHHDGSVHDFVYDYLQRSGIFDYLGGTPASTQQTGEQWDYPNAWAPLQDIIITALRRGNQKSREMAARLARLWVTANAIGFKNSGELFEKYDALVPGRYGGGGEYIVQAGFGWTNGLALDLITKYFTRTN